MNTLAFDTASPRVAAAIVRADGERVERGIVTDGPRHVEELIPLIEELLTEMSVVGAEIDRVVVGVGPGQFNGLRVGVTTANMLARVWKCELVGVSTLEALAWPHRFESDEVVSLLDARRRAAYFSRYASRPWSQQRPECMFDIAEIADACSGAFVVATPSIASVLEFPVCIDWPSPLAMIDLALGRDTTEQVAAVYVRPVEESI